MAFGPEVGDLKPSVGSIPPWEPQFSVSPTTRTSPNGVVWIIRDILDDDKKGETDNQKGEGDGGNVNENYNGKSYSGTTTARM